MSLICRFSSCQWRGSEDEIFEHFECYHKKFLREPKGNLYFDFSFQDLQQECFVLCSPNGLYWFRQKLQPARKDGIDFGVFHIGGSEQVNYELKLGLKRDGHCEYWGPYTSEQDNMPQQASEQGQFNFGFDFDFLEMLNITMPSRRLRLYFGEYDDSDDKIFPQPEDIDWNDEDESLNRLFIEQFTCGVCFEYIRRDARFCENKHFICLHCFDEMQQRKKLKCPTCRGQYLFDCMDPDIERLLRMVKWPDTTVCEMEQEIKNYLKSLPEVKIIKVKQGENY